MTPREDVAAMLRAGASYRKIRAQLGVSNATIFRVRTAIGMPTTPLGPRPRTEQERRAATLRRHPEAAAMLRAGASYRQIRDALGLSPGTISSIRKTLRIPTPPQPHPTPPSTARTPAEALAHYSVDAGDGHTHWTGPRTTRGMPLLWASGRCYSTLRITFGLHHGRDPVGPVRRGGSDCDDPHCITGQHLTDRTIRDSRHRADQAFEQIFGSPS